MAYEFYLERVNATRMRVYSDEECIFDELNEFFKYDDPKYDPTSWRHRNWDGKTRLFDKKTGLLDIGLLHMVLKFAKIFKYKVTIDPRLNYLRRETKETIKEYVEQLELTRYDEDGSVVDLEPYGYQHDGVYLAIKKRRLIVLAATGAGKSLMQYIMLRYWLHEAELNEQDAKVLMVVPSQLLCTQLLDNFVEYSQKNGWNAHANCHAIYGGAQKSTTKPVVISTWQAIQNEDKDWFKQFTHLCVDEVHGAAAAKVTHICKSCVNCEDRIGLTATLKDQALHQLQCMSHFGPAERVITTTQLQELGQAAKTNITLMNLNYDDAFVKFTKKLDYQGEIEALINHPERNRAIINLGRALKGNSLLLFDRVEHMEAIATELRKYKDNVHVINGDVNQDERDRIKKLTERGENYTIIASYGTMSTGVSIRKLHNLVFCHPSKAIIRILQSIGRVIRMHSSKDTAFIYDLIDNLTAKNHVNYAMAHAKIRFKYYMQENHPTKAKKFGIKGVLDKSDAQNVVLNFTRREEARQRRKAMAEAAKEVA